MLTLYDGTTSVCAIKVRLVLAEKAIDYESTTLDLRKGDQFDPGYMRLNPGAVVPTLIDGSEVITESSVIMQYLDDIRPDPTALPHDPADRARMRLWLKRIDDPVHPACGVLTHATAFRPSFLALTADQQKARFEMMPDPGRRARQQAVYKDGLDAPIVRDAARHYDRLIRDMDAALADAPFLCGGEWSLADAAATPYINRATDLGLLDIWAESCPNVTGWFDRIRERPSFAAAVTRYFTEKDARQFEAIDRDAPGKVRDVLAAAN